MTRTLPTGRGYAHIPRHKQLHRHAPDEGLIGDCWRTCLACLMGLKPTEVPHFLEEAWGKPAEAATALAQAWLAKRNLTLLTMCLYETDAYSTERFAGVPYILTGRDPGSPDICHAVVGYGQFKVLHDPAYSLKRLEPIGKTASEPGHYFLEFLVPLILPQMVKDTEHANWSMQKYN